MTEHDSDGYIANRSIKLDDWRKVCPEMPAGIVVNKDVVPPGMFMFYNYFDAAFCRQLVAECNTHTGIRQSITDPNDTSKLITNNQRTSEVVELHNISTDITGLMRDVFTRVVAPHFKQEIEWFESPQILRYHKGGEYIQHADSENWFADDKKWRRTIDRDISILLYINEEYNGGEIVFPNFGVSLKPSTGLLVAFPSDNRYLHTARPVIEGVRYAIVSWAAVKGSPRVKDSPPPNSIYM